MPAVQGKRVVIYGDSLSSGATSPGGVLAAQLRAAGADVHVNARVGRSAWNFYQREDAAAQLAVTRGLRPDVAIIVLGTNDMGLTMSADAKRMRQLRDDLAGAGAQVWAFGPPSFQAPGKQTLGAEVVTMMHDVFGDRLLDLRPLTADVVTPGLGGRAADGVHFSAAGGKVVGHRMADTFLHAEASGTFPVGYLLAVLLVAAVFLR